MVFTDVTHDSSPYQLVEFYAKSCPHCVNMKPVWEAARSEGVADVSFTAKECYGDKWTPGKDLGFCQEKGIGSFPTLVLYKNGTGEHWTAPQLMGSTVKQRAGELLDFVQQHTTTTGDNVTEANIGQVPLFASLNICTSYNDFI